MARHPATTAVTTATGTTTTTATVASTTTAIAIMTAWAATPPASGASDVVERPAPAPDAPDLFVVLLDTLRADHLGAYGYERETSPRIDALAREGQVFERAYSSSNWTRPALASLHTSTLPVRHQVIDVDRGVPPELDLLTEKLQQAGYTTLIASVGANFEPSDGYDRGVDAFYTARTRAALARTTIFNGFLLPNFPFLRPLFLPRHEERDPRDPDLMTARALELVDGADPERPLFLFLHYLGPHDPYAPPPPYDERFGDEGFVASAAHPPRDLWAGPDALSPRDLQRMIDQYDEEIWWHDEWVGRLFDGLRERGRLDDAVFLITSDHGEGFGEHGMWAHNVGMFEEVTQVPLVVWSSAPWSAPRRHEVAVNLIDVAPTLTELAGAGHPPSFDGESLVPWLSGESDAVERTVFLQNPLNGERGLRSEDWAWFEEDNAMRRRDWLYRAADRTQELDLSGQESDVAATLAGRAREREADDAARRGEAPTIALDDARREQLRALGYLE